MFVPTPPGVTVLYGKNGVGKSRLLRSCLASIEPHSMDGRPSLTRVLYDLGYVQYRMDFSTKKLSDFESPEALLAADLLGYALPTSDIDPEFDVERSGFSFLDGPEAAPILRTRFVERIRDRPWAEEGDVDAAALLDAGTVAVVPVRRDDRDAQRVAWDVFLCAAASGRGGVPFPDLGSQTAEGFLADLRSYYDDNPLALQEKRRDDLPVDPLHLGAELPDWAALPAVYLGRTTSALGFASAIAPVDLFPGNERQVEDDLGQLAWTAAVRSRASAAILAAVADRPLPKKSLVAKVPGATITIEPVVVETLSDIAHRANESLKTWFSDPPLLRLKTGLSLANPVEWYAEWRGTDFPIRDLGDAHRRFTGLAIREACARKRAREADALTIALVDEPERAAHPQAAIRIASSLRKVADRALVASHSFDVLDVADTLLHVRRDPTGSLWVDDAALELSSARRREVAETLGVSVPQLVTAVRVVVLVEGPQDQVIIDEWCREDLRAARGIVVPMGGTKGLSSLADTTWLVHATDAHLLVVVDNVDGNSLTRLVQEMRGISDQALQHRLRYEWFNRERQRLRRTGVGTGEAESVDRLLAAAVENRSLASVEPFAFKRRDIVHYLPPAEVVPGFDSWRDVEVAFLARVGRTRMAAGDGEALKKWVNTERRGRYTVPGVAKAARRMAASWSTGRGVAAERPQEFTDLGRRIRHAGAR